MNRDREWLILFLRITIGRMIPKGNIKPFTNQNITKQPPFWTTSKKSKKS